MSHERCWTLAGSSPPGFLNFWSGTNLSVTLASRRRYSHLLDCCAQFLAFSVSVFEFVLASISSFNKTRNSLLGMEKCFPKVGGCFKGQVLPAGADLLLEPLLRETSLLTR